MNNKIKEPTENKCLVSVLKVFAEINKASSLSKSHTFELVKYFKEQPRQFVKAFKQSYLKVFKCFHEKSNKKIPQKYEDLAEAVFKELMILKEKSDNTLFQAAIHFYNAYLEFLADAIFSSIMNIRIMSARMTFSLLKLLPTPQYFQEKTQEQVVRAVYFLIRTKVSTYKQIGIKLSSMILGWKINQVKKIEEELFKLLGTDQNEQIRKMIITNILITESNIDSVLVRLRDKSAQIRSIIIRKLSSDHYHLHTLSLSNIYKLLYDGFGNKDFIVKKETLKYFASYFDDRHQDPHFMEVQNKFQHFITLFQPQLLLINPHIYHLFDQLISELLLEMPVDTITNYIRKLCNQIKNLSKHQDKHHENRLNNELVWLKNACKCESPDISSAYEQFSASGVQLSKLLMDLMQNKEIYGTFQLLQLFSLQKSPDEIGRNRMFDSLKTILNEVVYFEVKPDYSKIQDEDDICIVQDHHTLENKKLLLSYYDQPIITSSLDLIYQIGLAMKNLRPDYFEIQMKQIMSDWNDPEENTLFKEKEIAITNIAKIQNEKQNSRLLESLKEKLDAIEKKIERESIKTRMIIRTICILKPNANMEDYMPIIKEELTKTDQSTGLILLGLYALESLSKVESFFPLYWHHLLKPNSQKIHILASLKVATDFIIKFDLLQHEMSLSHEVAEQEFNADLYIKNVLRLVIHKDTDIRILAIECLCRLVYHHRIDESNIGICFLYLLLLWWETSSEEVSAKSVHTISMFIRAYIEKSNYALKKFAEILAIFFKLLIKFQKERKVINKSIITYNLKMEEFIKKTVIIASTVLKYKKDSGKFIWKYAESGAELGPQEFFLLYLMHEDGFQSILDRIFNICDFYQSAPLETLIFVKKNIENYNETTTLTKKFDAALKKLEEDITSTISVKKQDTYNEDLLKGIQDQFNEYTKLIEEQAKRMAKNIEDQNIFVQNIESDSDHQSQKQSESQLLDEEEKIDSHLPHSESESKPIQTLTLSKNVRKGNLKNNKKKIPEENEEQIVEKMKEVKIESAEDKKMNQRIKRLEPDGPAEKQVPRNRRKKAPSPISVDDESQEKSKVKEENLITSRTRSRHLV